MFWAVLSSCSSACFVCFYLYVSGLDPPSVPEEGIQLRQLGLEEAFFSTTSSSALESMAKFPEGRIKLNHEDLWKLMERSKKRLAPKDGWVSLGFTMVQTNSISPSSCSSAPYAVLVMIGERKQERLGTWSDLHSMQRLCGSVAKTLLLLHVTPEADNTEIKFPFCLDIYHAEAVEVERWIPEKHREDVVLPSKTSKCWK